MRQITYWQADVRNKDGVTWRAWFGRVKDRTAKGGWRYFGPAGISILIHAAWEYFGKEALREVHQTAWNDVGPPGWKQGDTDGNVL